MNPALRELSRRYGRALQSYLAGGGEAALQEAYDLGRKALAQGLGTHDMAAIQHRALLNTLVGVRTRTDGRRTVRAAGKLVVESLLPFEMSHRRSQEVNAALRESEERYQDLVETARDVIFTLAADGKLNPSNPAFETVTGWSRSEWIGKGFASLVEPDDRSRAAGVHRAVLESPVLPVFELGIRAKSGATIPVEFVATPLMKDEKVVGILGVARDITDRRRAQEALRHQNEVLEDEIKRIAHALHDEAGQLLAWSTLASPRSPAISRRTRPSVWRMCGGSWTRSRSSCATCPTSCARPSSTIWVCGPPSSSSPTGCGVGPASRSSSRDRRAAGCPRRSRRPCIGSSRRR